MPHDLALQSLRQTLDELRQKRIALNAFCQTRHAQVMDDLQANLAVRLDKASQTLATKG